MRNAKGYPNKNPPDVVRKSSGRVSDLDQDKLRGGYYTSTEVATWLCSWAIRTPTDSVLEPSCGNGSFLEAAAKRFLELGTKKAKIGSYLSGVEIIAAEADHARETLRKLIGEKANTVVETSDFFSWWQESKRKSFDAVIGNPPFIRYQTFPEPHRSRAMAIMAEQGLSPNKLTNIWVPFVVAAVASLNPGGRMALVLPAELLQVTYAAQLRSFLTDRFNTLDIVACNELFFANAEQEVVLLLAEGARPIASETDACRVTMTETQTLAEITREEPGVILAKAQPKILHHSHEKWLKYFLTEREIAFMRALRVASSITTLSSHATVDVGVVTGKNEFFVLTAEQVKSLGLEKHMAPLVSRSIHLKGAALSQTDWQELALAGDRVYLLALATTKGSKPTGALARYIRLGEGNKVDKGYKCSIREHWYEVPSVWIPDGFLFRQIYDFPRMVLNHAGATSTDTIHRLKCKKGDPERIIANTYTWMTAASAEIEGRSYGGGVLELEPTEAERLLIPATLNGAMSLTECDRLTRAGRLNEVLEENARVVLMGHLGLSWTECQVLREIWIKMRDRRMARRRRSNAPVVTEIIA